MRFLTFIKTRKLSRAKHTRFVLDSLLRLILYQGDSGYEVIDLTEMKEVVSPNEFYFTLISDHSDLL